MVFNRTKHGANRLSEQLMMSLVCVDELKLLKDIERLIKSDIPKLSVMDFEPDPSLKPQPLNNKRGKQQQAERKSAGKKTVPAKNRSRSPYKGRSSNQSRSGNRVSTV